MGSGTYIVSAIQEQQSQLAQTKQAVSVVQGAIGIDPTTNATFASLNISGQSTLKTLTVTDNASFTGTVTVNNLIVNNLTINGHIITSGNTPTVTIGPAAGTADEPNNIPAPTVTIDGNDTAGTITITTGANTASGELAKLLFATPFNKVPKITLTPIGSDSAKLQIFVQQPSATGFSIGSNTTVQTKITYTYTYHTLE